MSKRKASEYRVDGRFFSTTSNAFGFSGATIGSVSGCVSSSWIVVSTSSPYTSIAVG